MKPRKNGRVIVTGGTGFIGQFLINALVNEGYTDIVNISLTPSENLGVTKTEICDLSKDTDKLKTLIDKNDTVVHLAWSGVSRPVDELGVDDIKMNLTGSLNLI